MKTSNVQVDSGKAAATAGHPPNAEVATTNLSFFSRIAFRLVGLIMGGLFVYAGIVKIIDPVEFARDIDNYKMLPWTASVSLALFLPWLEVFCGLALITRVLFRGGVLIVTVLLSLFIVASIVAKARGLDVSCGCFGHASKYLNFSWHLVLDFLLVGGLLLLWKRPPAKG